MGKDEFKQLVESSSQGPYISIFSINATNGLIDTIFNDFESRICQNCRLQASQDCTVFDIGYSVNPNFGCNEFSGTTDEG